MNQRLLVVMIAAACSLVGCASSSSGRVDIGDGHGPAMALGASLTDYAGVWDGYAEAFMWNDGTDRVRITLDAAGAGTLEVGSSPALPAPDPAHGYPPGENDLYTNVTQANVPVLIAGFGYPVRGARVESNRIRLSTAT